MPVLSPSPQESTPKAVESQQVPLPAASVGPAEKSWLSSSCRGRRKEHNPDGEVSSSLTQKACGQLAFQMKIFLMNEESSLPSLVFSGHSWNHNDP